MKFKGYIFDMDGTLVDNGQYHILAWQVDCTKFLEAQERMRRSHIRQGEPQSRLSAGAK